MLDSNLRLFTVLFLKNGIAEAILLAMQCMWKQLSGNVNSHWSQYLEQRVLL